MGLTVLVTGASGFIAKHIVLALLERGHDVVGSVRSTERGEEVRAMAESHLGQDPGAALRFVELDLTSDEGWAEAMAGVDVLMHTASPFPLSQPKDEADLIRPAVEGTLRALRAARDADLRRVILTSSVVSVAYGDWTGQRAVSEADWSDPTLDRNTAYTKSKTLAEQAAWDFVGKDGSGIALTVINPALVLGPPADLRYGSSLQVVERILKGKDPMLPQVGFGVVDVRDIALMHVRAMERDKSIGQRFIGSNGWMWFAEAARVLKEQFPERRIPTRVAPNALIRLLGLFDPSIGTIRHDLGRRYDLDNTKAREVLGVEFRPAEEALRASARFLVKHNRV
ncbi:MAG: SDR family oxidoreductase [Rubricella sp.]